MAELFSQSGQSEDVAVAAPNLQGIFLPSLDNPTMPDGFGLSFPLGGGPTRRQYLEYGVGGDNTSYDTLLTDVSNSVLGGAGVSYNFEGLLGPQGPPGPPGPPGQVGLLGLPSANSNFLTALPDTLDQINDLGTAVDKMLYTSAYTSYRNDIWLDFQPTGAEDTAWGELASDSDGSHLIIAALSGRIYTSADSGATWIERRPAGDSDYTWKAVDISSDGSYMLAVKLDTVHLSTDYGVNWSAITPSVGEGYDVSEGDLFTCGAMDSDGSNLIVGVSTSLLLDRNAVYTSSNSGASWTARTPAGDSVKRAVAVASNSDGTQLIVTNGGDSIIGVEGLYISYNSGATWTDKTPGGAYSDTWARVDMDSDGSHILAINADTTKFRVFLSKDNGATWGEVDHPDAPGFKDFWKDVAVDSDGSHLLMACATSGRLYTSLDGGTTWIRQDPSGTGNLLWFRGTTTSDGGKWLAISSTTSDRLYISSFTVGYNLATWSEAAITSAARGLLDDTTQGAQQTTLGLGPGDSPTFTGLTLSTIPAEATDVDKFLVDSTGVIKYRTGAELLSDIGGASSGHLHDGATLEHDAVNSDGGAFSFATTGLVTFNQSIAAANYVAANLLTAAATNAGEIDFTAASKKLDIEDSAVVDQDYSSDASPTFAGLTIVNAINEFSTDGTMGGNSDSAVPTEKATKLYTDTLRSDLASVANAKGASLVGVEDSATYFDATDVEAALAELMVLVTPVEYNPVMSRTAGGDAGGNDASVATIDDADSYDTDELSAAPGFDIQAVFSGVTDFNQVQIHTAYDGNPAHVVRIDLDKTPFNWSSYDTILVDIDDSSGNFIFNAITVASAGQYINSGEVRLRFYHSSAGNATHDFFIDYCALWKTGVSVGVTEHGGLTGLDDVEDHPSYLLLEGSRALAGAWDMGSQALTNVNIDSGVITGITDLLIADGGTGQSTAQAAIDALSAVSGATNEHVLTKDTGTGNAIWKAAAGGGASTWLALTDTDPANYAGQAGKYVKVNGGEAGLEFGSVAPGSGDEYVDRGDPATYDWEETGSKAVLNTDATWRDLDCSGTVPVGATAIAFRMVLVDDMIGSYFLMRKNGNSNDKSAQGQRITTANATIENYVIIHCDSNRVVEYNGANVAFALIRLSIVGWFVPAGTTNGKVKVDIGATADYLGATNSDGVLRTGAGLTYADGGNFVTLTAEGFSSPIFWNMLTSDPDVVGQGTWARAVSGAYPCNGYLLNTTTADGDNFTLNFRCMAGTYTLKFNSPRGTNRGIIDIYVDGSEEGSFDNYNGSTVELTVRAIAGIVIATSGTHTLKFQLDGKHASSSDYIFTPSGIQLLRTA